MSKFVFLGLGMVLFICVLNLVVKLYKDRYAALSENYFRSVEPLLNSLKRQLEQLDIDYCLETISIDIYNSRLEEINNRICEIENGAKKLAISLI